MPATSGVVTLLCCVSYVLSLSARTISVPSAQAMNEYISLVFRLKNVQTLIKSRIAMRCHTSIMMYLLEQYGKIRDLDIAVIKK